MKIYDFLKEKILYIISMSVVTLLTFLIIWALNPVGGPTLALLIVVLEIVGTVLPLTFEYINKKEFYQNLILIFNSLDRKNLIR